MSERSPLSPEDLLRIIKSEALRIVKSMEHLDPQVALPAAELAFISIIHSCLNPESRKRLLELFFKHATEFFETSNEKREKDE